MSDTRRFDESAAMGKSIANTVIDAMQSKLDAIGKRLDKLEGRRDSAGSDKSAAAEGGIGSGHEGPNREIRDFEDPTSRHRRDIAMADMQARADAVAQLHGMHAPAPLVGEMPQAYERRLVLQHQNYSPAWRAKNLSSIFADPKAFRVVAEQIYADSIAFAAKPEVPAGELMQRIKKDDAGHEIREYFGSPAKWMNDFSGPVRQHVKVFHVPERYR